MQNASATPKLFCSSPQYRRDLHCPAVAAAYNPLTRSKPQPRQPHVSPGRPVHVVVVSCSNLDMLEIGFFPGKPQLAAGTMHAGSCRERRTGRRRWTQYSGARSPDPKPATADMMVPLPTSHGDGVMLQRGSPDCQKLRSPPGIAHRQSIVHMILYPTFKKSAIYVIGLRRQGSHVLSCTFYDYEIRVQ